MVRYALQTIRLYYKDKKLLATINNHKGNGTSASATTTTGKGISDYDYVTDQVFDRFTSQITTP